MRRSYVMGEHWCQRRQRVVLPCVVGAIWTLTFVWNLGGRELTSIVEARVGTTAREMWRAGEWVLPTLNGELRLQKPPLAYWAVQFLASIRGDFDDAILRLPFALFAGGALCFTFAMGLRLDGAARGFLAGTILLTSALFVKAGRAASADVALLFCVSGAWHSYLSARLEDCWHHKLLFWAFLGLGNLAKGPVVLAIVLLPMIYEAALSRSTRSFRPLWSPWGWILFLALTLAWPLAVLWRLSDHNTPWEVIHRWYLESFGKILPSDGIEDGYKYQRHAEPFYFYLLRLPAVLGVWIVLLVPLVARLWIRRSMIREELLNRARAESWSPDRLPVLWTVSTLLFFSLISEKKIAYLLPILPATSLWLAELLHTGHPVWRGRLERGATGLSWIAGGLTLVSLCSVIFGLPDILTRAVSPASLETWRQLREGAGMSLIGITLVSFLGLALFRFTLHGPGVVRPALVLLVALGLDGILYGNLRDHVEPATSFRRAGRVLRRELNDVSNIVVLGNLPGGLLYYLDRHITVCPLNAVNAIKCLPGGTVVLAGNKSLDRFGVIGLDKIGQRLPSPLDRFILRDAVEAGPSADDDTIFLFTCAETAK